MDMCIQGKLLSKGFILKLDHFLFQINSPDSLLSLLIKTKKIELNRVAFYIVMFSLFVYSWVLLKNIHVQK